MCNGEKFNVGLIYQSDFIELEIEIFCYLKIREKKIINYKGIVGMRKKYEERREIVFFISKILVSVVF